MLMGWERGGCGFGAHLGDGEGRGLPDGPEDGENETQDNGH